MKPIVTACCLVLALLLAAPAAIAQPKQAFALRYNAYNYLTPRPDSDLGQNFGEIWSEADGWGVEAAYYNRISPRSFVVIPAKFGKASLIDGPDTLTDRTLATLDIMLQHMVFKHSAIINPFLQYGFGGLYNITDEEIDFNIPLGAGVNIRITNNLHLTAQTQYRPASNKRDGWHHGIGLQYFFGVDDTEDRDKDGTPDVTDNCPDVPGLTSLMGCPDRDGDGIADQDDSCPDQPGVAIFMGCPDTDGDGIPDKDDDCPTEAGIAGFRGCPDTDGDGVADKNDRCPTEVGPVDNGGCPIRDRDKDGTPDDADLCPDNAGPVATKGCPDRDSDGIADKDDQCPDKAGTIAGKGCPDTDGDGIYDNEDRCPTSPGPASNRGCPEIKQEDKAKVELAIKNVQFNSAKATLLTSSYKVLDDIADIMKRYPDYDLRIEGHTDSQGDAGVNQKLSENRAKACFDYLITRGVSGTRMSHTGSGESKSKADNMNAAGRAQNRRVEFDLYLK